MSRPEGARRCTSYKCNPGGPLLVACAQGFLICTKFEKDGTVLHSLLAKEAASPPCQEKVWGREKGGQRASGEFLNPLWE